MPKNRERRDWRTSAILVSLLTVVFLTFGATLATADAGDEPEEGSTTGSPAPTATPGPTGPTSATTVTPDPTIPPSPADEEVGDEADTHEGDVASSDEDDASGTDGHATTTDDDAETLTATGGVHINKSANVDSVIAAGGDVTFSFVVQNTANASLEITALSDSVFGSLAGDADCHVGTVLAAGASCSFTLTEHLSGTAGQNHVNVVTVTGQVGGNVVTDVDSEAVLFVAAGGGGGGNGGGGGGGGNGGGGSGQGGGGQGGGGADVLGTEVTQAPGAGGLAFTGGNAWILAALAVGLFLMGLAVLLAGRRLGRARS